MFVNAPIDPEKITQIREIMQAHGVMVLKIRPEPEDHWWHFFFPEGTTQRDLSPGGKKKPGAIARYEVVFPDGYQMEYEAGKIGRDGLFRKVPVLFLRELETPNRKQTESQKRGRPKRATS